MTISLKRNGERVFLTGATGYVGSAVAARLVEAGYAVHGLTRSEDSVSDLTRAVSNRLSVMCRTPNE